VSPAKVRWLIHAIAFGRDADIPLSARHASAALDSLKNRHARWWNDENVVGLCVARKLKDGRRLRGVSLQVLVREKRRLPRSDRYCVPRTVDGRAIGIPDPFDTDVRAVGAWRPEVLVSDARPVLPGFNVGGERVGSGTLTCVVRSRSDRKLLGLSCGHVIARSGLAAPGEPVMAPSYENAVANELLPMTPVGRLAAVLPIGFEETDAARNVDAATFEPTAGKALDSQIAVLGKRPTGLRSSVTLGLLVQKVGYATEHTVGVVQALDVTACLQYPKPDGSSGDALFADLIGISSFTQPGDSGALVLDDSGAAVGLHIGSFNGMSVAIPMKRVLDAVDCELA